MRRCPVCDGCSCTSMPSPECRKKCSERRFALARHRRAGGCVSYARKKGLDGLRVLSATRAIACPAITRGVSGRDWGRVCVSLYASCVSHFTKSKFPESKFPNMCTTEPCTEPSIFRNSTFQSPDPASQVEAQVLKWSSEVKPRHQCVHLFICS